MGVMAEDMDVAGVVDRGESELHFQPEVDLGTGQLTGMEALVRWSHPARGLLWPADFLPAVREAGLLPALGRWVAGRVAAEVTRWPLGTRCTVNVSAEEVTNPSWAVELAAVVAAAGVPPGALLLDIPAAALTESTSAGLVEALHAAGVLVATAGPAPAGVPVDVLTVGRALVAAVETDDAARAAVAALVATGLPVAANGVETWAEAAVLHGLGVQRATGFLFGAPQRADRTRWQLAGGSTWRGSYVGDGTGWGHTQPAQALDRELAGEVVAALPDTQEVPAVRAGLLPRPSDPSAAAAVPAVAPPVTVVRPRRLGD